MSTPINPIRPGHRRLKRLVDLFGAALLVVLLLPLLLLIALAIKLASRGPVFFVQRRCGLHAKPFRMVKFRTMVHGAEALRRHLDGLNEADGPVFKMRKDPRIVPYLGTFLRRTGLDELPQLVNVLKGEMSLVGPRPPIPSEVSRYDAWQRRRLSIKPGITGLWQCASRRHDLPFHEWMVLDLSYIDSWSFFLDLKIVLKTTVVVFTGQGR